ncbi:Uncharacterized conserved protein, DUF362 family [Desulfatibacillum alkenivorans DSM 16219]|jgi:uncharacterized protein (DUF362 family)/ferredoxin|uniref:Uncharacterized conserved protein, DUF362 family n=1 Tax=Desulfatibacillum alkenivorans DSM 16219 TaxID=1121393 RepID=A0A1M6WHP1_9BACT|nr:DUF362 domain-containing protein [Desulfatibacillum alkenivorans]SHK93293.1 Uncharacterized conserved protein, DUF362 family [Desulfatibacillum alkenivorans DSM 16219]
MNADNRVMILDAAYDEKSLKDAVEAVFREFPLDLEGKTVLVKPNILAGEPPEKGVTTHPMLVKTVVEMLKAKGAEVMVGDNPGVFGYGRSEKAAETARISGAAGGAFVHLGQSPVKTSLPSQDVPHVMISNEVLTADLVINLPKLKTHGLTFYTGAVKNTFGYVVGGDKMRVHSQAVTPKRFSQALVDIFSVRPPDLTIMDAVVAMEGNGPHHGSLRNVGKILASGNAVSLDAVAVTMIGGNPRSILHLDIAAEKGLGAIELDQISLNTEIVPIPDFKMPVTFVPGVMGMVLNRFLSKWINCLPQVQEDKCKQCGLCVKHCPTKAMTMAKKSYPKADKNICINCYCCQEMCPEDAIVLKGRTLNFIRGASR